MCMAFVAPPAAGQACHLLQLLFPKFHQHLHSLMLEACLPMIPVQLIWTLGHVGMGSGIVMGMGSMDHWQWAPQWKLSERCFVCGVTLAWLSTCVLPMHPCLLRQLLGSGLARAGAGWWSLFGAWCFCLFSYWTKKPIAIICRSVWVEWQQGGEEFGTNHMEWASGFDS